MTARRFVVRGRVQGVGFRYFVLRHAEVLGLAGWVRNRRDGSVEVLAAGPPGALAALEGQLWGGPAHAHVVEVTASEAEAPGQGGFTVLPSE